MERDVKHEGPTQNLSGRVTDVFAHRFVVETEEGKILAFLGPKGAERVFSLKEGDHVELTGDMKPSELKVRSIAKNGAPPVLVDHPDKPRPHPHAFEEADSNPALKTVEANGFTVLGRPRRKPKHFEILGRDPAGDMVELHVELDGSLRKTHPVQEDDPKWVTEIKVAR
jgi:hypothetical protein